MPVHVPVPVPAQCPMSARSTPGAVVLLRNPPQRCGFSHQLRAAAPAPGCGRGVRWSGTTNRSCSTTIGLETQTAQSRYPYASEKGPEGRSYTHATSSIQLLVSYHPPPGISTGANHYVNCRTVGNCLLSAPVLPLRMGGFGHRYASSSRQQCRRLLWFAGCLGRRVKPFGLSTGRSRDVTHRANTQPAVSVEHGNFQSGRWLGRFLARWGRRGVETLPAAPLSIAAGQGSPSAVPARCCNRLACPSLVFWVFKLPV